MKFRKRLSCLLLSLVLSLSLLPVAHADAPADASAPSDPAALLATIAAGYQSASSGWSDFDLAAYSAAQPDFLTAERKQSLVNTAISACQNPAVYTSTLAQNVLTLRALGIDPAQLTDASGKPFDALQKLTAADPRDQYTAPYVLLALGASDAALTLLSTAAGADFLFAYSWGGVSYPSFDQMGAALAAVAPLAASNEAAKALQNGILTALAEDKYQQDTGCYGNANTDAMVLLGLVAAGKQNDSAYLKNGKSVLDGLLTHATADGFAITNGSTNSSATEQGFRALLAATAAHDAAFNLYAGAQTLTPGIATPWASCPVQFTLTPKAATVSVATAAAPATPLVPSSLGKYDLPAGDYIYTVSAQDYVTKSAPFTLTAEIISAHVTQKISVALEKESTGGDPGVSDLSVTFTLVGDTVHEATSAHIYKDDHGAGRTWIPAQAVSVPTGSSVYDVFSKALSAAGDSYVGSSYISSITHGGTTLAAGSNGAKSGWMYLVNGLSPTVACADYSLRGGETIVFYYTDDYAKETGSESYPDDSPATPAKPVPPAAVEFTDVPRDSAYFEAIACVQKRGLMQGVGEKQFAPDAPMTRAMLLVALYREDGSKAAPTSFPDAPAWCRDAAGWAEKNGIAKGSTDGKLNANAPLSAEQLAVFLYRYVLNENATGDSAAALLWAKKNHLLPASSAPTRGETAAVLAQLLSMKNS